MPAGCHSNHQGPSNFKSGLCTTARANVNSSHLYQEYSELSWQHLRVLLQEDAAVKVPLIIFWSCRCQPVPGALSAWGLGPECPGLWAGPGSPRVSGRRRSPRRVTGSFRNTDHGGCLRLKQRRRTITYSIPMMLTGRGRPSVTRRCPAGCSEQEGPAIARQ